MSDTVGEQTTAASLYSGTEGQQSSFYAETTEQQKSQSRVEKTSLHSLPQSPQPQKVIVQTGRENKKDKKQSKRGFGFFKALLTPKARSTKIHSPLPPAHAKVLKSDSTQLSDTDTTKKIEETKSTAEKLEEPYVPRQVTKRDRFYKFFHDLRLLMIKNVWLVRQQRKWLGLEIAATMLLYVTVVVVFFTTGPPVRTPTCRYGDAGLPSAGPLNLYFSLFCAASQICPFGAQTKTHEAVCGYNRTLIHWIQEFMAGTDSGLSTLIDPLGNVVELLANSTQISPPKLTKLHVSDVYNLTRLNLSVQELKDKLAKQCFNGDTSVAVQIYDQILATTATTIIYDGLFYDALSEMALENYSLEKSLSIAFGRGLKDKLYANRYFQKKPFPTVTFDNLCFTKLDVFDPVKTTALLTEALQSMTTLELDLNAWKKIAVLVQSLKPESDRLMALYKTLMSPSPRAKPPVHQKAQETPFQCGTRKFTRKTCMTSDNRTHMLLLDKILTGYILITPDNKIVRHLVEQMKNPINRLGDVLRVLYALYNNSASYQRIFDRSDFGLAVKHVSLALDRAHSLSRSEQTKPTPLERFRQGLSHLNLTVLRNQLFDTIAEKLDPFILQSTECFRSDDRFQVVSETELEELAECLHENRALTGAVSFYDLDKSAQVPPFLAYAIRLHPVDTYRTYDLFLRRMSDRPPSHEAHHFLTDFLFAFLQDLVDHSVIETAVGYDPHDHPFPYGTAIRQNPSPCAVYMPLEAMASFLPNAIVFVSMLTAIWLLRNLIHEKKLRFRQFLKIMGTFETSYWVSWGGPPFLKNFTMLCGLTLVLELLGFFPYSDVLLFFPLFLLFSIALILQTFVLSVLFDQQIWAVISLVLVTLINYLPYSILRHSYHEWLVILICLLPQSALGLVFREVALWEHFHVGLIPATVGRPVIHTFSAGLGMLILLLDSVIYFCALWYLSKVFSSGWPFYFLFTKSFWKGSHKTAHKTTTSQMTQLSSSGETQAVVSDLNLHEVSGDGVAVLTVQQLCKYYSGVMALDSLEFVLHEHQVTAVLGPARSGKSTFASILTGLAIPYSGNVYVYDTFDIWNDMASIRKLIGFCPQYDMLCDDLTVKEHLDLFGMFAGMKQKRLDAQSKSILSDLDLQEMKNSKTKFLSTAQRRGLMVAMAFMGGRRLVILDEPTSTLDQQARNGLWKYIMAKKKGRTVLLLTPLPEEAELLADRMAFLIGGRLRCSGSPHFVRKRFGADFYRLVINCDPVGYADANQHGEVTRRSIADFLNQKLDADLQSGYGLTFKIEKRKMALVKEMFEDLEANKQTLGVTHYALRDLTMDELFMRLCMRADTKATDTETSNISTVCDPYPVIELEKRFVRKIGLQVSALIIKRFHNMRRDFTATILSRLLPLIMLIAALFLLDVSSKLDEKPILLTHGMYGSHLYPSRTLFYATKLWQQDGMESMNSEKVLQSVVYNPGMGVHCMKDADAKLRTFPNVHPVRRSCTTSKVHWSQSTLNVSILKDVSHSCTCTDENEWECAKEPSLPETKTNTRDDFVLDASKLSDEDQRLLENYVLIDQPDITSYKSGALLFNLKERNATINVSALHSTVERLFKFISDGKINGSAEVNVNRTVDVIKYIAVDHVAKAWHNGRLWASLPNAINSLHNTLYRRTLSHKSQRLKRPINESSIGIATYSHPFKYSDSERASFLIGPKKSNAIFLSFVFLVTLFCFLGVSVGRLLVSEETLCLKIVQRIVVRPPVYYGSYALWDFTEFAFTHVLVVIAFLYICGRHGAPFVGDGIGERTLGTFLVLVLYSFAFFARAYNYAERKFYWSTHTLVGFAALIIALGYFCILFTVIEIPASQWKAGEIAMRWIGRVFMVVPQFTLYRAIYTLIEYNRTNDQRSIFHIDILGDKIIFLFVAGIGFWVLFFWMLYRRSVIDKSDSKNTVTVLPEETDEDVAEETKIVQELLTTETGKQALERGQYPLVVKGLTKRYVTALVASVRNVSVAVQRGECFGFLSWQGTCKTTMMHLLLGECPATEGEVYFNGISWRKRWRYGHLIGYCPEGNAVHEFLSVREQLYMHARLRGVKCKQVKQVVDWLLKYMKLEQCQTKTPANLSRESIRKLVFSIALVGDPSILLLDEPTAGADEPTKRLLWSRIRDQTIRGKTIILMSNSLEECQAVCSRVAVLINGALKALGSVGHLLQKFSPGYYLSIKLSSKFESVAENPEWMVETCNAVLRRFPGARVRDQYGRTYRFIIPAQISIPEITDALEALNKEFKFDEQCLTQLPLDDILPEIVRRPGNRKKTPYKPNLKKPKAPKTNSETT